MLTDPNLCSLPRGTDVPEELLPSATTSCEEGEVDAKMHGRAVGHA